MKFEVLTAGQILRIHESSIQILEKIGFQLSHPAARSLFRAAHAEIDESTERVRISERLVMESLARSPAILYHLRPRPPRQASFGAEHATTTPSPARRSGSTTTARTAATPRWTTSRRRPASPTRCRTSTSPARMADPHELPVAWRCVEVAAALLRNTTKPITFWFHDRASARYLIELFAAVAAAKRKRQHRPSAYPFLEPISPLQVPASTASTCSSRPRRLTLPVPIGPMAQVGAVRPGTLAGTLAQENAEILAGAVHHAAHPPGTPVCYGGIPHAFDMRTTQLIFAGPEQALMAVAMTQMGKHYGLPVYINVGLTDSKLPDAQAGLEAGITLALGALAGADIFGHLGICGVDQAASLAMLVMQHEMIGYVERLLKGIEISDDTLALDVIASVAPAGGVFLGEDHTAAHFRKSSGFPGYSTGNSGRAGWTPAPRT